jgi:hypothetical protein
MDIYRFFHPHHNPRLLSTAPRQQEIGELEQAASETLKAVQRIQQRCTRRPAAPILPQHFSDIIKALQFVTSSLATLNDAHPGDTLEELGDLIAERADLPGWSNWTKLVREQILFSGDPASDLQEQESSEANSKESKKKNEDMAA